MDILSKYLTEGNKLNHSLLFNDLAEMTGFQAERRRGKHYWEVTNAYNNHKMVSTSTDDSRPAHSKDAVSPKQPEKVSKEGLLTEESVTAYLNEKAQSDFVLVDDEFSRYDAEEERYIAEIKIRNSWYPDCLIEYDKFDNNAEYADEVGKEFLYVVATSADMYIFNVTALIKAKYDFRWNWKHLPRNTDFGGYTDKIAKQVGYIDVSRASVHYKH